MPKNLHIFRAGTHTAADGRSLAFSEADLAATARAYDPARHEAPLVVGHPEHDSPAFGWVRGLEAGSSGLSARAAQIDPAFAEAVAQGRYKKISAAFYHPESSANPVPGVWYLRHVGFLGGMPPAIKGLTAPAFAGGAEDFVIFEEMPAGFLSRLYELWRSMRDYLVERDGVEAADRVVPAWRVDWLHEDAVRAELQDNPAAFAETNTQKEAAMPDLTPGVVPETPAAQDEGLRARLDALEKKEAAFAEKLRRAEAGDTIKSIIAAGKLAPAQAEGLVEFMASLNEEASVAFGEGEARKMIAPAAFLRDFLDRLPVQVAFKEASAPDPSGEKDGASPEEVARRAVIFQAHSRAAGVEISVTEAVAAVLRGEGAKEKHHA